MGKYNHHARHKTEFWPDDYAETLSEMLGRFQTQETEFLWTICQSVIASEGGAIYTSS